MLFKPFSVFEAEATYGAVDNLKRTMDRHEVSLDHTLPFVGVITPQAQVKLGQVLASLTTNVTFIVAITEVRNYFIVAIS
jgi:hypothetical protein